MHHFSSAIPKPKLLIVEQDVDNILFLLQTLSDLGEACVSNQVTEALALIEKNKPNLVFLGTRLPEDEKQALTSAIRLMPISTRPPVVVQANCNDADVRSLVAASGAAAIINKPFDTQATMATIHQLLAQTEKGDLRETHIPAPLHQDEALHEKQNLLMNLAAQVPGIIFQYRLFPDGRSSCPFISESIRNIFGLSPEELQENASAWTALVHPDDMADFHQSVEASAKDLSPWCHEYRAVLPTQDEAWFLGESKPQKLEDGSIVWHGYIRDITQRKNAEKRERRLIATHRALKEVTDATLRLRDESTLFPLVCRIAVDYGEVPLAWVGVPREDGQFSPVASWGTIDHSYTNRICILADKNLPKGRGPIGTAFREKRTVMVNDIANDPSMAPWKDAALKEGLHAITAFPILKDGKPYAVLAVYNKQPGAFNDEIVGLLEQMAVNISFALENFDRETERKRTHETLQLTQLSLEKAVDPVFWMCKDANIKFVNNAVSQYLGYSRDELLTFTLMDINPHLTPESWLRVWSEIKKDGAKNFESFHRSKEGKLIPVEITANYVEYGGQEYGFAFVRDISDRKKSEEAIWERANFDALTCLPNRRLLMERLQLELLKTRRVQLPLAMIFLDIDHFKNVNDTLGHATGDLLLKEAAERLTQCVRQTDMVARLGGDEFTIILSELADLKSVDRIATNVLQKMAQPFHLDKEIVYISASIGITLYPNDATNGPDMLKNADQAMYEAKKLGRNRYTYFDIGMQEAAINRHKLIKHLHGALERQQFEVVYQPIVSLLTGEVYKAEALLRWHHPTRGSISPAEFIPLAEQTGLIIEIGDWVFQQVAAKAKKIRETYQIDFQISINKSPVQFHSEETLYKTWMDHLHHLGLPGNSIAIEITESLLMESTPLVKEKLNAFRKMGMQISLDDFGTGYSSLSYLKKFEFDFLKIDQSFVKNLTQDSPDMALCEAIIMMAHRLGFQVIAEGVETEEQHNLLRTAGCDYAQGYLFSRPISSEALDSFIFDERIKLNKASC